MSEPLLLCCFGPEGESVFDAVICGEDVRLKKPDPEVYTQCLCRLGVEPVDALTFEDFGVGLRAALAAGITSVVTPSIYTSHDDFTGAFKSSAISIHTKFNSSSQEARNKTFPNTFRCFRVRNISTLE